MHCLKWLFAVIFSVIIVKSSCAQYQGEQLTPAIKIAVIDSLTSALLKNYIYPDTAKKMSSYIKAKLKTGAYDTVNDPNKFAQALKSDLYVVYRDLHLSVYYDPDMEKGLQSKSYMQVVTDHLQFLKFAQQQNFGFSKIEILDSNIGYVSLTRFFDVSEQSTETVRSVFSVLRNTNALIIDLRYNSGGEADMVKYICSFFFKEKTHINDQFEHRANKIYQYWTQPLTDSSLFFTMPLYILVNGYTYSAAEEFAYDLQNLHRATIVGEITGGAAHPVAPINISNGFFGNIPYARAINPVSKKNWEGIGVKPDISVNTNSALDAVILSFYDRQISISKDSGIVKTAKWMRIIVNSKLHPFSISIAALKTFVGNYNGGLITVENGQLYFTATSGNKTVLVPLSQTVFTNNNRRIEFHQNNKKNIIEMDLIYEDGQIEKFNRNK